MTALNVFFSYAHEDEALRDELDVHLALLRRSGQIDTWHDRKILPGGDWAGAIDDNLEAADVILLLVSPAFIDSDYCWDVELKRAMERHEAGEARVIPIILRPADWHDAPFGKLQALPREAKPITTWSNRDEAYLNVARGLRAVVDDVKPTSAPGNAAHPPPAPAQPAPSGGGSVRAGTIKAKNVAGVQIQGGDAETAAGLAGAGLAGGVDADEIEAEHVTGVQHLGRGRAKL